VNLQAKLRNIPWWGWVAGGAGLYLLLGEGSAWADADGDYRFDTMRQVDAKIGASKAGTRSIDSIDTAVIHRLAKGRCEAGPNYVRTLGDGRQVSWHFTVHGSDCPFDVTQHLPLNVHGWQAGVAAENRRSVGIELDAAPSGNPHDPHDPVAIDRLVQLLIALKQQLPNLRIAKAHHAIISTKPDPGKAFPWDRLRALGLQVYPGSY
jgi:N-acetyl-anhydromuramyl-L-alanine amidase AmpD